MSAYADLIERLQRVDENECYSNPWSTHRDCNDAAAAISRLEREKAELRDMLVRVTNAANNLNGVVSLRNQPEARLQGSLSLEVAASFRFLSRTQEQSA